ncbi:MAG: helix-turn-helix transcriptional regulator [Hyphomonas sp.]|jgi:transcriptional regulator with XRE-family HTH domain|uniref:helix-turn-helix domain-containing protein n=1 Tax=Hyphomonas sp. TaxID=87 RepID=UPI003262DB7E
MRTGRARGPTSKNRRSQGVRAKPTSRSPTEIDKLVGTNVRRVRLERGLTLSDLGEQLGISHQQLQKYETGTNRLSAGMLCALAEVLEVRIESLFNDVSAKSRGQADQTPDPFSDLHSEATFWVKRIRSRATLELTVRILKALSS